MNQFDSIRRMFIKAQKGLVFPRRAILRNYTVLEELVREKQGFYSVIKFLSLLYELSLYDDARVLSSTSFARIEATSDSRRVQKVQNYISENYREDLSLNHLADLIGMTPVAFSRFFKVRTGKNLSDYIINIRLGYASRKLIETTDSIAEICDACGFNNLSNFNRLFKKKKLCTPKEFRENYKKTKIIV